MQDVIGWDIGGAHVKAARAHEGRIVAVTQRACAPHTGLASLEEAVRATSAELGPAARHHVTMTAELSDAFEDRARGVISIAAIMTHALGAETFFYAGAQGLIARANVANSVREIASANWRASAELAARCCRDALFIDIGSTTADLIPIRDHVIVAGGVTDAERLALGELAYAGFSRGAPQAYARQAPIDGRWTPLVNEAFADLSPTADGRPRTRVASAARLARLVGLDAEQLSAAQIDAFAHYLAQAQLRVIEDQIALALSYAPLAPDAPFIGAGVGRALVARLAQAQGRAYRDFASLVAAPDALQMAAADCAPAAALALLVAP